LNVAVNNLARLLAHEEPRELILPLALTDAVLHWAPLGSPA
jgi:hypothetical protein